MADFHPSRIPNFPLLPEPELSSTAMADISYALGHFLPKATNEPQQNNVVEIVDTTSCISNMIDSLQVLTSPSTTPSLYIDLEGEKLSRHGTISLLQIFFLPKRITYLVDVLTLGDLAFTTCGADGHTLKDILESEIIPKVIFDVRRDSDALYSHFGVNLAGIHDLQLLELATRGFSRRCVNGLAKCIERDAAMAWDEKSVWKATKEKGLRLFAPEKGGSYQVFNERPLSEAILNYCAQDVQFLPRLWSTYRSKLMPSWEKKVKDATRDRILLSKSPNFNGDGQHMAMAPAGWA